MSKKLLLADDSVTIQRVIELTFSSEDVQVLAVGDGEEAIARIVAEKPDIVLADIGMPKRSGYEVSAFVKGKPELSHIPVLLLAGAFEPVDDAKAKESQCDGVLVKPFEPQHVIARVRELIGGAKGSPTQPAVSDIPRPAAAFATPRHVELPKTRPPVPADLMDVTEEDLLPRHEETPPRAAEIETTAQPIVLNDSLDNYFDKLDEAFSTINASFTSAAPHEEFAAPPAERARLDSDLAAFDLPPILEVPSGQHLGEPPGVDPDPFAGMDAVQPEESTIPTLDDLLAGMPPGPDATELSFETELAPSRVEELDTSGVVEITSSDIEGLDVEGLVSSEVESFAPSHVEGPVPSNIDWPLPPSPAAVPTPVAVAPPPIEPPDATPTLTAAPPPQPPPAEAGSRRSIIADAFSALLAAEQGETGAAPVRLAGNGSQPVVTDAMIDDVARRVVQRLALGSSSEMQAMVKEIVSSVAERLVREEIDRIRRNAPRS